ncbi:glycolate oxidase subunit GlcE [Variovorax sp. J22R133]|uniref:glycolate oxidase subunit GlcE n=1 Tax=Variovorax brevis TaxID=3053503 RepID=UPI0025782ADD|nr:glycolate oxidase subunit GlcE [Variovorax sp. J22R133]MDM0111527.1 glycolate oxidase subunit GlcE [Variovorax sp. J22R133]
MTAMDSSLQAMVEPVRAASASATPLRIRGGGTKDFYGDATTGELLDTTTLVGVVSYEPSELVVTVRTGTRLADLEALLRAEGQCLAFEPPRFAPNGTVGGMVAAGLSGPSRASVGSVRDHVLGAELLNGKAQLLRFGGTVMKNVAGYDVSRVLAGSLGTLGLITEVSLKVLPVPPAEATLLFDCSQADALRLLNGWGGQPLPLNASCWVEDAGRAVLYLRLRGAVAAVEAACKHLGGERLDNAQTAADWDACRDQTLPWFTDAPATHDLWRVSVPQTAPVLDIDGEAPLIEWHGAQRWYRATSGQGAAIRTASQAVGGHATLFKPGNAAQQTATRFDALSPALARVQRNLMDEFDPHRIFNRGRLAAEA